MTISTRIIYLPINPSNEYGKASTLGDIVKMIEPQTFYVGTNKDVEEMNVVSSKQLQDGTYEITTDKAILIGLPLTRVNLKSNHKI